MAIELWIFRHGETDYNKSKRIQGILDIPLNATGLEQAKALAEELKYSGIQKIYSSPLERAKITAQQVADKLGLEVELVEDLKEISLGTYGGSYKDDIIAEKGKEFYEGFFGGTEYDDFAFPEGESKKECRERFIGAILRIAENSVFNRIAISTHGMNIKQLLIYLGGPDIKTPKNCGVLKLQFEDGELSLLARDEGDGGTI